MILLVSLIASIIASVFLWQKADDLDAQGRESSAVGVCVATIIVILTGVVLLISIVCIPTTQYNSLRELESFYESNAKNYSITLNQTEAILSQQQIIEEALIPIQGSIEKSQLASVISERLKEYRDEVNNYNISLRSMRYWDSNIFLGLLFPTPPDYLLPIVIE